MFGRNGEDMFTSKILRFLSTVIVMLALALVAFADTIRLKDGSIIKGRIVSFNDGKFVVSIGDGSRQRQLTLAAADIESITFDSPPAPAEIKKIAVITTPYGDDNSTAATKTAKVPVKADLPPTVVTTDNTGQIVNASVTKNLPSTAPKAKPIELSTKVLADNTANGWTNTGWVVKKGQKIRITGSGAISLGKGQTSTASGRYELEDDQKLLKSVPTGALLAVIGDDNNDFIYIGAEREFTAARDGALFLGINEGNLDDNSGAFDVKIEIEPGPEF